MGPRAGAQDLTAIARREVVALISAGQETVWVLGIVSTKVPELEQMDALRQRIDEASTYHPLEYLAISPRCGSA